jgi:hypothetical protein
MGQPFRAKVTFRLTPEDNMATATATTSLNLTVAVHKKTDLFQISK